ncbi:MAG: FAD-dependent oxidoreductase, partial [Planctomycetota bacterium]
IGRLTVANDFRSFDPRRVRVVLIESASRVLPPYSPSLSKKAKAALERLGVEVRTDSLVTAIDAHGVCIGKEQIFARTVLWAAGVSASPLGKLLGTPTDRSGRVLVAADLSIQGHTEVFVVGDLINLQQGGQPIPGIAPVAIQSGRAAAKNILRRINGKQTLPFHYVDKGSLATIGRASAVGKVAGFELSGYLAWFLWWLVHIAFLVGFRNRLVVMLSWAWQYFAFSRGARLITGRGWEPGQPQ